LEDHSIPDVSSVFSLHISNGCTVYVAKAANNCTPHTLIVQSW